MFRKKPAKNNCCWIRIGHSKAKARRCSRRTALPISNRRRSWNSSRAHLGDWLLLQKEFCGLNPAVGVEPVLHNVVAEKVGQREQAHSLMVNHPGCNQIVTGPAARAGRSEEHTSELQSLRHL